MTKQFELERDPSEALEYFRVPRKYSVEQPNTLTAEQERMQAHYSTAQRDEMLTAVGRIVSSLAPQNESGKPLLQ